MKHVLSILLLLTVLPAFAQKATVERVASDPLNIAASKYPMTDLNGHTAPLVIVEVLTDNVEFKGNVLDGGVVRRTGEYWVYMGVGTKILRIQSDKFLPVDIRFPDYGIPRLEPASTYVVTLALPGSVAQSAGGGSLLVVNVKPAGANIAIDGVAYGVTPNAIEGLAVGKHDVRVSHAGYATATFTTSVSNTDISTVEGSLELLPEPQAAVPIVAAPASDPAEFSATPAHLALCATGPDGRAVYITADQWQALSDSARSSYTPLGVCLTDGDEPFLIGLRDKGRLPWTQAQNYILPTKGRADVIARNRSALDDALLMFGAEPFSSWRYWTATEYGHRPYQAWFYEGGYVSTINKVNHFMVRPVVPVPVDSFPSTPVHLALCATGSDGRAVYIAGDHWRALSDSIRASYTPHGVCLSNGDETFLVEMNDAENGKKMKWDVAKMYNLPTLAQAEVLKKYRNELKEAMRAFGGAPMDLTYWTATEYKDNKYAWSIHGGGLYFGPKKDKHTVRAIESVTSR